MNEHTYSTKLRQKLIDTGKIYQWKINDAMTNGVPDRFVEGHKADLWIEAKHIKSLPIRHDTIIDVTKLLSKLQYLWLKRREKIRGDTAVLVSCPLGAVLFLNGSWETPLTTLEFSERAVPIDSIILQILQRVSPDE